MVCVFEQGLMETQNLSLVLSLITASQWALADGVYWDQSGGNVKSDLEPIPLGIVPPS